jgi:hypothetical protein
MGPGYQVYRGDEVYQGPSSTWSWKRPSTWHWPRGEDGLAADEADLEARGRIEVTRVDLDLPPPYPAAMPSEEQAAEPTPLGGHL